MACGVVDWSPGSCRLSKLASGGSTFEVMFEHESIGKQDILLQKGSHLTVSNGHRFLVHRASLKTLHGKADMGGSVSGQPASRRKICVIYENERCPWSIKGPDAKNFGLTHLRITDRPNWSSLTGDRKPDIASCQPPQGHRWEGKWVKMEWEYAGGWNETWHADGPKSSGTNCWVRRMRCGPALPTDG